MSEGFYVMLRYFFLKGYKAILRNKHVKAEFIVMLKFKLCI